MNRRDVIKNSLLFAGYTISAASLQSIVQSCSTADSGGWKPAFFSKDQMDFISAVFDTIIPDTPDSPGAVALGVDKFLDTVAAEVMSKSSAEKLSNQLNSFKQQVENETGSKVVSMSDEAKLSYFSSLNLEEIAKSNEDPTYTSTFLMMKEMVIGAYYATETIAKEVLVFNPVPGPYKGCVPVEEATGGKTWAL
ncbi:MAG: gluconate 2-dehydrogenase subunit 3 family protein [Saprospiraceae bacterium]|jgi:hypothetical protein